MGKDEEGSGERLRVMVVDDHALFRRGLEMVLQGEPDLELVGEASDGAEAVDQAQELMPDVVLMDVRMPKRSGIEAAGQIKDLLPHVKILMLTISDDEADLYEAIKAGASGYLLKEIPIEEVADADPLGVGGPIADLTLDGVQAPDRVRRDVEGLGRAAPDAGARSSPTARWRSFGWSRRGSTTATSPRSCSSPRTP